MNEERHMVYFENRTLEGWPLLETVIWATTVEEAIERFYSKKGEDKRGKYVIVQVATATEPEG